MTELKAMRRNWRQSSYLRRSCSSKRTPWGNTFLSATDLCLTLQLVPSDHSTLDRSGIGMRAKSPEVSQYCSRVLQAANSGRLQCARDQQNVHADDLQI